MVDFPQEQIVIGIRISTESNTDLRAECNPVAEKQLVVDPDVNHRLPVSHSLRFVCTGRDMVCVV
jgi:hypothetical protein